MDAIAAENFRYDPTFKVHRLPHWQAKIYKFLSVTVWGQLPMWFQKWFSGIYASLYSHPYSKWIIKPYANINYSDKEYFKKFKPPMGKSEFECFQDFFIREFRQVPRNEHRTVWPCEGFICEHDLVGRMKAANVKGDIRSVATIFGCEQRDIPSHYKFSNVFLHNKNYHRIHAPISGTISRVQHIPGDLLVLRPWIYKQNPSLPAFRNERYNIDITDEDGHPWHLSVVGGPAVGTVKIPEHIRVGTAVEKLEELAVFYLGSTCCIAAPLGPKYHKRHSFVEVGTTY